VRKEMGYPPLVTPSSQIVGTQATLNVVLGKRYKVVPEEVKNYFRGFYGRPPAPMDPEIRQQVIGDEEPIACRPADRLAPGLEKAREEIGDLAQSEEDVLSYALFPQVARPFLTLRRKGVDRREAMVAAVAARLLKDRERTQMRAPAGGGRGGWKAAAGAARGSVGWGVAGT